MTAIQTLIRDIKNLTPVPAVVQPLLEAVDRPDVDIAEIARIIQYDPALTASALRTSNSAFFGLKQPAETIKDAVALLGTDQVVDLVSGEIRGKGPVRTTAGIRSSGRGHVEVFRLLCPHRKGRWPKRSGWPTSTPYLPPPCSRISAKPCWTVLSRTPSAKISTLVVEENYSFMEAEKKVIGVDHAELGGMIAKMWKFSPRMVNIIRNHHLPRCDMVRQNKDVAVVYLADCICMMMGMGVGADGLAYRFHQEAMDTIGITAENVSRIIAEFACRLQEVEDFLRVV